MILNHKYTNYRVLGLRNNLRTCYFKVKIQVCIASYVVRNQAVASFYVKTSWHTFLGRAKNFALLMEGREFDSEWLEHLYFCQIMLPMISN